MCAATFSSSPQRKDNAKSCVPATGRSSHASRVDERPLKAAQSQRTGAVQTVRQLQLQGVLRRRTRTRRSVVTKYRAQTCEVAIRTRRDRHVGVDVEIRVLRGGGGKLSCCLRWRGGRYSLCLTRLLLDMSRVALGCACAWTDDDSVEVLLPDAYWATGPRRPCSSCERRGRRPPTSPTHALRCPTVTGRVLEHPVIRDGGWFKGFRERESFRTRLFASI
ncbi:hypothetical protein EXIGLDRAFT_293321 [Exidia glandulosa HHB12029]|uniref:Uncharacterized protein n=1 Tax=Exidia glandulosa HHB12029 TaxID=1314781 RepID=A0A165M2F5_EXIGL|nr:hypothetical protein EXIGLDRAFT_293321 [Exidia glandulosa HHB12029]